MGVFILGLFIGSSEYTKENGSKSYAIMIATERDAYRVFMAPTFDPAILDTLSTGVPIRLTCRPYVGKNGTLTWGGGHDLRVGE